MAQLSGVKICPEEAPLMHAKMRLIEEANNGGSGGEAPGAPKNQAKKNGRISCTSLLAGREGQNEKNQLESRFARFCFPPFFPSSPLYKPVAFFVPQSGCWRPVFLTSSSVPFPRLRAVFSVFWFPLAYWVAAGEVVAVCWGPLGPGPTRGNGAEGLQCQCPGCPGGWICWLHRGRLGWPRKRPVPADLDTTPPGYWGIPAPIGSRRGVRCMNGLGLFCLSYSMGNVAKKRMDPGLWQNWDVGPQGSRRMENAKDGPEVGVVGLVFPRPAAPRAWSPRRPWGCPPALSVRPVRGCRVPSDPGMNRAPRSRTPVVDLV